GRHVHAAIVSREGNPHVHRGQRRPVVHAPQNRRLPYNRAMPTAGILVIGNEILSGKVIDTNSPYLCRELRTLGVDVERIITIPDNIEVIAEHVRVMHKAYDLVFTSGGIGP